jgi:hypothetical protein
MAMEDVVEAKRVVIVRQMKSLGARLETGDDAKLLVWVIPNALACAHRPLRHHPNYGGSGQPIPTSATPLVHQWVEQLRAERVESIISFMHDRDLRCYRELDLRGLGFVEFLRAQGFNVAAVPWEDPHHRQTDAMTKRKTLMACREAALEAFDRLPKPVVLQCSAGIDRSAPAAAYIWAKRGARG